MNTYRQRLIASDIAGASLATVQFFSHTLFLLATFWRKEGRKEGRLGRGLVAHVCGLKSQSSWRNRGGGGGRQLFGGGGREEGEKESTGDGEEGEKKSAGDGEGG